MHEIVTVVAKYFILIPFAALFVAFIKLHDSQRKSYLVFAVVSLLFTLALTKLATILHSDPRPFVRDGVTPYFSSATDNGFPSDHTLAAAFSAMIVGRYYRWAGVILLVLAVLIGWARVVGGVHHAQDIIGGFLTATLGVALGYFVSEHAIGYMNRREKS